MRGDPPQVIEAGDLHGNDVIIVFASSGEEVPWLVTSINCPERYLVRYMGFKDTSKVREDGDFRVEWRKDDDY